MHFLFSQLPHRAIPLAPALNCISGSISTCSRLACFNWTLLHRIGNVSSTARGGPRRSSGTLHGRSRSTYSTQGSTRATAERGKPSFRRGCVSILPEPNACSIQQGFFDLAQAKLALGAARVGPAQFDLSETLARFSMCATFSLSGGSGLICPP